MSVDRDTLKQWVRDNGTLWETSTGCWVRCYLDDLVKLLEENIEAAEKRGARKARRKKHEGTT